MKSRGSGTRSSLLADAQHFGWTNILLSFDAIASYCILAVGAIGLAVGWFTVSPSNTLSLSTVAFSITIPLLALTVASLALVSSLASDELLLYLTGKDYLALVFFPFHWNSIVAFVSLVTCVAVRVTTAFVPVPHWTAVVLAAVLSYTVLSSISMVTSLRLFLDLRITFLQVRAGGMDKGSGADHGT
jgi:hypothetical protein